LSVAAAWAIAAEHRHFVPLLIFAAFRNALPIMLVFLFLKKAATGMVGPPLGRTAADVAVAGAFPGHCMGYFQRFERQRRERARNNQRIDYREKQSNYVAGWFFHASN